MKNKGNFKKQKLVKTIIWIMLFALLMTGQTIQSFATNYSVLEPTRLVTIGNEQFPSGHTCTDLSGMAYSNGYNRLYTAKVFNGSEISDGYFYYYPNVNNMSNYKKFLIKFIGHANAMTVDSSYVYITATNTTSNGVLPESGVASPIIRISRSYIHNLTNGSTINLRNPDGYNIKVFEPKYWHGDNLEPYSKTIGNITKYNTDGTFIINISWQDLNDGFAFTTAQIETVNGNEELVVNRTDQSIFVVHNNLQATPETYPDIEYSPDCGLFIPRWYGTEWVDSNGVTQNNACKNVILWANLDGPYTTQDIGSRHDIRVYTPDKINLNAASYRVGGTQKYTHFELESVAIINYTENSVDKADLLFSANVQGISGYGGDGIFRLKRSDSGNFKIA